MFDCSVNNLTELENLPSSLIELNCSINRLEKLENLPVNLNKIFCTLNNNDFKIIK